MVGDKRRGVGEGHRGKALDPIWIGRAGEREIGGGGLCGHGLGFQWVWGLRGRGWAGRLGQVVTAQ